MYLKGPLRYPSQRSSGSLLIVTLWMIMILTILSFSIGQHVRQKISLADRIERRNWLYGIAEIGVFQTLYKLRQKKEADLGYHSLNDTYTNGEEGFSNIAVGEGTYTISFPYRDFRDEGLKTHYGVEDEEGKININVLDAKILSAFFQRVGEIDEDLADELSYSIVDWRDPDNSLSHPEYGAEDDYYDDLETPYGSRDSKFESLEELLLVRGMTPELFEKVKPFITIHGEGVVNINTAPPEVLIGLGMDDVLEIDVVADIEGRILSWSTGVPRRMTPIELEQAAQKEPNV